jgi:signal peptidase I
MLPILIALLIIAVTVVFIFLFVRRFTIVRINGDSMFPTLKDGQIRLVDRLFIQENLSKIPSNVDDYTDRIYILQSPTGRIVIKRLIYISVNTMGMDFWFEGDNHEHSEDSRHYGFVRSGDILGELVDFKTFWKRVFIF